MRLLYMLASIFAIQNHRLDREEVRLTRSQAELRVSNQAAIEPQYPHRVLAGGQGQLR